MTKRLLLSALCAGVVWVGCSRKSSTSVGTWSGDTTAPAFTVNSAIFLPSIAIDTAGNTGTLGLLSDATDACASLTNRVAPANAHIVLLEFADLTIDLNNVSATAPTTPGAFTVYDDEKGVTNPQPTSTTLYASGEYVALGPTCLTVTTDYLSSGTINLTSLGANSASGSGKHIVLADGSTVNAVGFDFSLCPGLANLFLSTNGVCSN